jgi:guanylate kinase
MKYLLAISGPSGAGKGTILEVLKNNPAKYEFSVSYTTRKPREGEIHSHHYHFINDDEFDAAVTNNEFLEWEQIHQNRYGTKRRDLEEIWNKGKTPVLEIDVKGVANLKKAYPSQTISVFIEPPSLKVLIERLKNRGTESEEVRNLRISRYQEEIKYRDQYDHIIINDTIKQAQQDLLDILKKVSN